MQLFILFYIIFFTLKTLVLTKEIFNFVLHDNIDKIENQTFS